MKKMYHLGNCTTCQAIIKETGVDKKGFILQDIKFEKITPAQLEEMKKMAGSFPEKTGCYPGEIDLYRE
jgi:arsenate reductase